MFKYLNNIIYIYIYIYITDRSQMVRHFLWVKDIVSSILAYLIYSYIYINIYILYII